MPKKFEGHVSGEVEVKPAKMLWENCLLPGIEKLEISGSLENYSDQECAATCCFPLIMPKENISVPN